MTWPIRESERGFFGVVLRPCTFAITALFVPESGATVWLRNHRPRRYIEWTKAQVALNSGDELQSVEVRDLVLDVQMPASDFRQKLPLFEDLGADLYLMAKPVPDTLTLEGIPEGRQGSILSSNGLIAYFHLPHSHEVAWLETPDRSVLEQWLTKTELSEWLEESAV